MTKKDQDQAKNQQPKPDLNDSENSSSANAANNDSADYQSQSGEDMENGDMESSPLEALLQRIAQLETELANEKDKLLRNLAETENTRRRLERDRDEKAKYAVSSFALNLVGVGDNLRRAIDSVPANEVHDEKWKVLLSGIQAIELELLSAFEKQGIVRIDPLGAVFNANYHQSVFEDPNSDQPSGTIIQVLLPCYMIHERLLRPAMVGISKGGSGKIDRKV